MVVAIGDDDSALIVDAHSLRIIKLAWMRASVAELEQERAIDRRQYLHSMVVAIRDDDSMSIIIDRKCLRAVKLAMLLAVLSDLEQEREIAQVHEGQLVSRDIGYDDTLVMPVDCDT